MKSLAENNSTMLSLFDELVTFSDNWDKGTNGTFEKSRFLSLFGGDT